MNQETLALHYGYDKQQFGTMSVPVYQTTAYDFGSAETAANRFALKELGPIYTRLNNPTTDVLEARIAAVENGEAAIATASGQRDHQKGVGAVVAGAQPARGAVHRAVLGHGAHDQGAIGLVCVPDLGCMGR